jgi:hypothetical protein
LPPYPTHQRTKGRQNFGETDAKKLNVRFGSKAEMCAANGMSALPPIADIGSLFQSTFSAKACWKWVRFIALADLERETPARVDFNRLLFKGDSNG